MNAERPRPSIITLTSDFGLSDGYVASMKGVLLGLCPGAELVDLSHEVPPHEILPTALILEATVPYFPPQTVHVVVVDPGVGSRRRALALSSAGHFFVGPDNGLFTPFLQEEVVTGVVAIEEERFRLRAFSSTFHGRDLFAPAAAALARGADYASLGPEIADPVKFPWPHAVLAGDRLVGTVLHVDHFGNCVTSIKESDLPTWEAYHVRCREVDFGPLKRHYAEVVSGAPLALVNSMGRLELAIAQGNAAVALGIRTGDDVTVAPGK
ncbi:MAG: SAM-dependent chlorinase/fluorinase [Candidatus Coatesbacteria bacterium]|nr:MAG: SAM-dependent chlorinase/fluorinase [Candidatus Coatesbacteria bacterium]